jgi:phosphoribosylaminoimidazole-succinocarboxamide synthase
MRPTRVLAVNDQLPIKTSEPVHSGKVRSVYWLSPEESARLIDSRGYDVAPGSQLAVMVVSDRLSAFDCIWRASDGLDGVPGKGAALNAISGFWFQQFQAHGLARSHILEAPHPLVWIVQRARPVRIEAIARQYMTGSMWRAYAAGTRDFCGIALADGLKKDGRLPELLMTPSSKGILIGIPGVPEADDVNISQQVIAQQWQALGFERADDVARYQQLLATGFHVISDHLANIGQLFVDTKFEFGYVSNASGASELIYMDEVGTPDSSRIWSAADYLDGRTVERSKEGFRQELLRTVPDPDVLLNKDRMDERQTLAREFCLPAEVFLEVAKTYQSIAEDILGAPLQVPEDPEAEIIDVLDADFGLIAQ